MTDPTQRNSVKKPAAKLAPANAKKGKRGKAPIEGKKASALYGGPKKNPTPYST